MALQITVFSDSHGRHDEVEIPGGDILIFAGDMTDCRHEHDLAGFNRFLRRLPHRYKVVIGGNHDHLLADNPVLGRSLLSEAIYLQDEMVVIGGITIYGSPWQPLFNSRACDAFALPRGRALQEKWRMIPHGIDILVTHAPPAGVLDRDGPVAHGCTDLARAVAAVRPRYHVFGHIHANHGTICRQGMMAINCNVQAGNGRLRPALSFPCTVGRV